MMVSKAPIPSRDDMVLPVDAVDAWERFSAAWPFDPVSYRRAAARAEFEKLTDAEREKAIRSAAIFAKAWRKGGRRSAPDARAWIRARGWQSARIANTRGIAAAEGAKSP